MPHIDLDGVCFAYAGALPLIERLTLRLEEGWTGVVGPNGAGKTTLFKLLAGSLRPDAGEIRLHPAQPPVLCRQEVETLAPEMEGFARSTDGRARRLMGRLRLEPRQVARWETLSPGERKRWQIAAALAAAPAVLLLDEPTNHLDAEARELLLEALGAYRGVGLVVSHDRGFLNALARRILRFHHGAPRMWSGDYDTARASWEAEEAAYREAHGRVKAEARKLARRLASRRRDHQSARAKTKTSRRMKGPRDSDARSTEAKGRAEAGELRVARQVMLARAQLERTEKRLQAFSFKGDVGRSLFVDWVPAPRIWLMRLETPELAAGSRVLLRDVRLAVGREDRIRVAGPNGAGKSTLITALVAGCRVPRHRLLLLPQELRHSDGVALLHSVRSLPPDERGRVLALVAALGVDPELLLASEAPSPGEARKLQMAWGLGTRVWGLVLDEPTNHLDLPSIERLEEALQAYPGALLMVTHDEHLARRTTSAVWDLRDGHLEQASAPVRA